MSDEIIPVALGSWFFTLDLEAPTTINPSEFFARVGSCLEAIQGVDGLRIDLMALPGEDTPFTWEPTAEPRYGEYVGPHWNFESVSFSLRPPSDVQGELLKPHRFVTGYEAEHFRVVFMYGWACRSRVSHHLIHVARTLAKVPLLFIDICNVRLSDPPRRFAFGLYRRFFSCGRPARVG